MNIPGFERQYLDLVALGTVADVVPLLGENRIIVKYGLPMIEKTSNVGLRSLIKVAGIENKRSTLFSWLCACTEDKCGGKNRRCVEGCEAFDHG